MALQMNVQTCQRCTKLFRQVRSPFCADCLDLIEMEFESIRDYLRAHPRATIAQGAAETGVPEKSILFLIREGRLTFGVPGTSLRCERCGTLIHDGRFCSKCVGGLRSEFLSMEPASDKTSDSAVLSDSDTYSGMHTKSKTKNP